jgi:hypothetical protein
MCLAARHRVCTAASMQPFRCGRLLLLLLLLLLVLAWR